MPAKVYTDKDADLAVLSGKTCAVIGFGSQGHAHALNLKESGVNVIIGLYEGSNSIPVAKELGFEVVDTATAVQKADVIFVAVPDTKIPAVYNKDIAPHLKKGKTLLLATASPFTTRPLSRPPMSMLSSSLPKALATSCAASSPKAKASLP